MAAVGVTDAARCVYVGDRLFDDIWGAANAGLRTVHIPHSAIPAAQVGHTEGEPDAVAHDLSEIPEIVRRWAAAG
jgi:putative hydrolase of the HAD superfamily